MRSFRDALLERGIAVRYYELPASLEVPFWQRLAAELEADLEAGHPGQGKGLQVAEIADRGFEQQLQRFCWDQCWFRPWVWPRPRRPLRRSSSRSGS
jgi:deoxyribodipyrimidine photolyase-related protein